MFFFIFMQEALLMIRLKSLQQRFTLFMMLPVALLLLGMGIAGFRFARGHLLTQWGETTILKLQRAAHHIDMRLNRPKEMLSMFHKSAGLPHAMHIQKLILEQLQQLEGITVVDLNWTGPSPQRFTIMGSGHLPITSDSGMPGAEAASMVKMMPFRQGSRITVEPPRYDTLAGGETVSLVSELKNDGGETVGRLEVKIRFDELVDAVAATGWWQDQKAFLVDANGHILASNSKKTGRRFGDGGDRLERITLYLMKNMPFGTILGEGFPPDEVSGFYKLKEAPWTLVIVSPGEEILLPILHFRYHYMGIGAAFIVVILLLIRFVTGRSVSAIKEVSSAAGRIAKGDYGIHLPVKTADEVGELTRSFNTMVEQLEERSKMKASLNLAREVQQNLLPRTSMRISALDVAGRSLYCDETGGDYYDYFQHGCSDKAVVTVGDVSGHGIAAALLMTTARAALRGQVKACIDPAGIITEVNRQLCEDTSQTGNFMTLFYLEIDPVKGDLQWVRAGHDPAFLYDPGKDTFTELGGSGIALGLNDEWTYTSHQHSGIGYGQVVLIGTDGIWESENRAGERFGKERLQQIIRQNSHSCAEKILDAIVDALTRFKQSDVQEDDITMVVVRMTRQPGPFIIGGKL